MTHPILSLYCPTTRALCKETCIALVMDDDNAVCTLHGVTVDDQQARRQLLTKPKGGSRVEPSGSGSRGVPDKELIAQAMSTTGICMACNSMNTTPTPTGYVCNHCGAIATVSVKVRRGG
jgi:hypothetical protein